MHWNLIITILAIAIVSFFAWANYQTKRQHAAFNGNDVISAIENVLTGDNHDEWDLFLSWPVRDPYLESIRQRCIAISKEYAGTEKGKDIATNGESKLRLILDELKTRA